jgi:hypothetical protein
MLSLDLFNSQFEKRLHEGAVDSTIEHLLKPLSLRAAEIRTQLRTGKLDPKQIDQLEREYEDLVQKRLDIILDRQPKTEQQQPQRAPAKGLLKGRDLVTPQQRVAAATPTKPGMAGAVKDVAGGIKRWLKGEPDQGPTYEEEQPQSPPLTPTLSPQLQSVTELIAAWDAEQDYIDLPLADGTSVPITRPAIFNALIALKQIQTNRPKKYLDYVNKNLSDKDTFFRWLANVPRYKTPPKKKKNVQPGLPMTPPPVTPQASTGAEGQPQAPSGPMVSPEFRKDIGLSERKSQKKKFKSVKDVRLSRELQKARALYPTAGSDMEAFAKAQMDANDDQDTKIQTLQQKINRVSDINTQLATTVNNLNNKLQQTRVAAEPATVPVTPVPTTVTRPAVSKAEPVPAKTPTAQAEPVPAPVLEPLAVEPVTKKTGKAVAKPKKPRVKKLPAKDMGPAVQVGVDQDVPELPSPDAGFDFGTLSATQLATQAIKKAKSTSKTTTKRKFKEKEPAEIDEHGGGIGPRQHWQSLMPEGWSDKYDPTPYAVYIDGREWKVFSSDEHARAVAEKVKANLKRQGRNQTVTIAPSQKYLSGTKGVKEQFNMPGTTVPRKSVIQGYTVFFNPETKTVSVTRGGDSEEAAIEQARMGTVNLKNFRQTAERLIDRIESDDQLINEGIKDTASATAVIACLLAGGALSGCATAPQKTTAQQVLKTGQDIGRTVQTAQRITRAGVEAEVNQEIRNLLRGIGGRPEELNNSNILRIWRRIKGAPPVQPEPQAPEYGPAEPVKRMPQNEAREIHTREDFIKERDRLLRMIELETDPANRQILKSAIKQLEGRAEQEGWISLQQRMVREDNASGAAEQAILKRIMVAHTDLLQKYGPQKVMQAAEEVAYNVGDLGEIGTSDVSGWVNQVKQILGATA